MVWLRLAITIWVLSWPGGIAGLGVLNSVLSGFAALAPQPCRWAIGEPGGCIGIPGLGVAARGCPMLVTGASAVQRRRALVAASQWDSLFTRYPHRQVDLQQRSRRHPTRLFLEQWQCVSHRLADPVPARWQLDDCIPDRHTGRRSASTTWANRLCERVRADHPTRPAVSFLMLPRCGGDRTGDECGRGAHLRDLHGSGPAPTEHAMCSQATYCHFPYKLAKKPDCPSGAASLKA